MISTLQVFPEVWVLGSTQSSPGHGVLPTNAFLVGGSSPVLIDTGLAADRGDLLAALWSLVSPEELAAVFLTHEDADHAGNLLEVLDAAPRARLVTNYVTVSKLLEATPVPLERVTVVNAGEHVLHTGRRLLAVRPPVYDAPGTLGVHDAATGAVVTVDAFGAYLPEEMEDLDGLPAEQVVAGLSLFNRMNHPWTALADRTRFDAAVDSIADLAPTILLSSHGALPRGRTELLLDALRALPDEEPYVAPDQTAFEHMRSELC